MHISARRRRRVFFSAKISTGITRGTSNGFAVQNNDVWLSEDNGKLNQLRLSQQALNRLSAIPSGTRVQALGQWGVSNINGQMVLDADDLSPYQTSVASTFINGRLNVGYNQTPTYSGNQSSAYLYSVVDDDGRVTQLSIPDNLSSQVLAMSGSRVRLLGSYIPTSYGGTTTFAVSQSLSVPEVPVQLNGTLANAGTNTPGIYGQTQSWLIDDSGKWNELRIPVGLSSLLNSISPNARVTVSGVYVNNATGSPAIELRDIREIRNFLTEITLTGTVSSLYGQVAYPGSYGTVSNLALTTDNGERYELRAGSNLPNVATLVPGARVQVVGTWSSTGSSGLGVIDARYLQPLATAFSTTTLDGTILGRDYSVFNSDAYLLQVSDGRVLRMTVPYGTAGIQQGVTLNNGSQIRVTGNLRTDLNEIEAREIISTMPTALPTTVTGTMLNWGYVGSMAQSLVLMESTGRVWQVGFLQPGTQINPQNTGLSPGMQLRVSGNARSDGTLDASLIEVVASPIDYAQPPTYLPTPALPAAAPFPYFPGTTQQTLLPGGFNVFDATITGWNAISDPYSFTTGPTYLYTATDDSGRALQLRVSGQVLSLATNTASLRVGGRVRVTGVNSGDGSNQIQVQRIEGVY